MPLSIVVGVSGGIAAYKSAALVRLLAEAGHNVTVIPTQAALNFVGAATWEALSGNPVHTSLWEDVSEVPHVAIGRKADLLIVAPATADFLARAATGQADDLLTNTLLTTSAPVLLAPAMHTEMWENPATVANVATLRARGITVLDPAEGRLTGADSGRGRLPEPVEIANAALALTEPQDLAGLRVLVSAGGTREPIDPVRWIGNRSSGRQGVEIARAAAARGADVTLVAANLEVPVPAGVRTIYVGTAQELREAVHSVAFDVVVMAAAVADFRPVKVAAHKVKKESGLSSIELEPTVDVLAELVSTRTAGQTIVGFAAETGDEQSSILEYGRAKLRRKGCDLLVVNDAATALGATDNEVQLLTAHSEVLVPRATKATIARAILDEVLVLRSRG